MQTLALPADAPNRSRADWTTIGVVGLAHGTSHFFHLLLPPLFPVFAREFGLSWAELGLLVSVFYAVSGVGQALSGFVVDRHGARPALMVAMSLFALASLAAGLAQGYVGLMLAAALAGLGNAPMHPADFSILNQRVSHERIGHAYSVHGISGNLGWALMPVLALAVLGTGASWRYVYLASALVALLVLSLLVLQREHLQTQGHARKAAGAAGAPEAHPLAFLRLPSIWLCFSFFLFTTAALASLQSFAPAALALLHGRSAESLNLVVTAYMLCGALGMLLGGFWVVRARRLERNIALALLVAMALLLLATLPGLSAWAAVALVALAGIGTGLAGPSRDLLVKQAAPAGATGRVYGTVYSGLDIGFAVAAPVAGALLDAGSPRAVFWVAALALGLALLAAQAVTWASRRV
ncbi:MFS transporter [Inhella proteolytica]|uniref:MFS transporter n=1 Tax=Inhella proteolytica TaxID=2795029 RepID=A0A931NEI1_9BURK|nr:MFS transporter [Inhella proteolytica]MBH9577727.1 MFS transporter [Inhella proteolytica]